MEFVLIVVLTGFREPSIATAEFSNKEACLKAIEFLKTSKGTVTNGYSVKNGKYLIEPGSKTLLETHDMHIKCLPKGTTQKK